MRRLAIMLALAGCGKVVGDVPGGGDGDAGSIDARAGAFDAPVNAIDTIRELRMSSPRNGDTFTLRNVVVVGRSVQRLNGVVYVQDEGGGLGTGIRLLCVFEGGCTLTPSQIMGLDFGDRFDVTGTFDLTAPPAEPQLVRFTLTPRGSAAPVATMADPAMVAHDGVGGAGAWILTYVRVNGPLTVTDVMPAPLRTSCPVDAGSPEAFRGVFIQHAGPPPVDLAVQTIELDYCVSQCGVTCGEEIMVDDVITSVTGMVIVGDRGGASAELLIRPAREQDLPH